MQTIVKYNDWLEEEVHLFAMKSLKKLKRCYIQCFHNCTIGMNTMNTGIMIVTLL